MVAALEITRKRWLYAVAWTVAWVAAILLLRSILPYAVAWIVAVLILAVAKVRILGVVYLKYKHGDWDFAGRNTWLLIECLYKVLIHIFVVLSGLGVVSLFNSSPTPWLLAVYAVPVFLENFGNLRKNLAAASPRPGVYFVTGLISDTIGLALGFFVAAPELCSNLLKAEG